ncbi:MAG: peptidase M3, partial [Nocardioides sp.]|nr:peptidase M3 [Nocardioides sp.]
MSTPEPLSLPAADAAESWVTDRTTTVLAQAREAAEALRRTPPADAAERLRAWDDLNLRVGSLAGLASLLSNVHPDEAVRTACEATEVEVDRLRTEL